MKFVLFVVAMILLASSLVSAGGSRSIKGELERSPQSANYRLKSGYAREYYRPRSTDYNVKVYDELKSNSNVIKSSEFEKEAEIKVDKSVSFQSAGSRVGKANASIQLKDPNRAFTAKYAGLSNLF